jgi:hypothetical protein
LENRSSNTSLDISDNVSNGSVGDLDCGLINGLIVDLIDNLGGYLGGFSIVIYVKKIINFL